ncbi:MAG TPA: acyltransferase [Terriglobales bacterium]|nr:acyltransferase [Terriglobales bacterium]
MQRAPSGRQASSNLDLLRSFAVLMVLFDHLCRHFYFDRVGRFELTNIGAFGVLLFFVHTSLVLMYSMERSGLRGAALLKNFYVRRFFRLYPLSVVTVLAAVALHLHANGRGLSYGAIPGPLELTSNLMLVQNLTGSDSIVGPLWSLPIEVQMYAFLPFLFLWRKRSLAWLLVLWAACGWLGHFPQVIPNLAWFSLLLFVPNFLPGVIAFSLPEKRTVPSYLWPMFIVGLTAIFVWLPGRRIGAELCLLLGCALPRFKEITFRPLKLICHHIANYSYGIYLGHSFCIWFGLTRHNSWILFWLSWIIVPVIAYHAIERPGIRLGTQLAEKLSQPRLRAVPAVARG